ncbi:unnamed protein product, partial [Ectocarpus sp. 6 AP-2014]
MVGRPQPNQAEAFDGLRTPRQECCCLSLLCSSGPHECPVWCLDLPRFACSCVLTNGFCSKNKRAQVYNGWRECVPQHPSVYIAIKTRRGKRCAERVSLSLALSRFYHGTSCRVLP